MWNSENMEPSGHMSLTYFLFLCILTGVATIIHQVMASDYFSKSKACTRSFITPCHAKRLASWWHSHCWQWVCQIALVPSFSESLKHHGMPCTLLWSYAASVCWHHQIPGDEMAPCVGKVPALIPSLSCSGDGDMETAWWHAKAKLSLHCCPLLGTMSLQDYLSGTLSILRSR